MSAKFTLKPKATFDHTVYIPQPGAEDAELVITFKHKSLRDLKGLQKEFEAKVKAADKANKTVEAKEKAAKELQLDFLFAIAEGWELADEFSREVLGGVMDDHARFFDSVSSQYQAELWAIRQKR